MKINKKKLIDIIKEEIGSISEAEYQEPDPNDNPTPDAVEVLIPGYGGLTIGQIKNRVASSRGELEKQQQMINDEERELQLADGDDDAKEMLIRSIESRKRYLATQEEVVDRFIQTLQSHNISS